MSVECSVISKHSGILGFDGVFSELKLKYHFVLICRMRYRVCRSQLQALGAALLMHLVSVLVAREKQTGRSSVQKC